MVNYANSKLYTIHSLSQPELVYVGSTTQPLYKRLGQHKSAYKSWKQGTGKYTSSFKIIDIGDAYIELLKLTPCTSKEELTKIGGDVIRSMDCVNIQLKMTDVEKKDKNKKKRIVYYNASREKRLVYLAATREKRLEKQRAYDVANREKINKRACEQRKKDRAVKVQCECGRIVSQLTITRHRGSTRHIREFIMS